MNKQEIKETPVWKLYEKGRNFHRLTEIYTDTDRNYRFFNGNQWEGVNLGDIEPLQKNFIKPIVKYKVAVVHDNLYAIVYSSMNFANEAFRQTAEAVCGMLNHYAARVWEQDKMDYKWRAVTKDAAINSEGLIFADFDTESMMPKNEIIDKCDVYYGNENNGDIQSQPYILIRKRMSVSEAVEFAKSKGMSQDKEALIIGDNDTFEESGEAAKQEVNDAVTVIYKLYRIDGIVHYSIATRLVTIVEDIRTGMTKYPLAHIVWEEKKGSARGEGEVKNLIPNQIEVNKTEMRRVLTVKQQAYPKMVADETRISNPDQLDAVGGIIKTKGNTVDDVRKIVGTLPPAQMSSDVKMLQDDLIYMSRELAGAGEAATGQVNPETSSGRAILAVQSAARAPLSEQKECFKQFVEDIAAIWLEYVIVHSDEGINLEHKVLDQQTGQETVKIVNIPQVTLKQLNAAVKIDVTPKSVYDRYAQEMTLENFLTAGLLRPDRIGELEVYVSLLDDDSVVPKRKLLEAIKKIKDNQKKIAQIQANAQAMQQRVNNFLMEGPQTQASQPNGIRGRLALAQMLQQGAGSQIE